MSDEELRRILVEAVPDEPAPPDRMGQIASRVRRRRIAVGAGGAAVAVAVAVVIALPTVLTKPGPGPAPGDRSATGPALLGPDACPERLPDRVTFVDRPGSLVPDGADRAVLCESPTDEAGPDFDRRTLPEPRVLTRDIEGFVAALNALPDRERFWQVLREREAAKGNSLPPEVKDTLGEACTLVGYTTVPSFVLRYPDGASVVVQYDQNCGTVTSNGRTRFADPNPINTFIRQYRAQIVRDTDPASVPTPTCPAGTVRTPYQQRNGQVPRDEMSRHRGLDEPLVTAALLGIAACRYTVGPGGPGLVRQASSRDVTGWAEILNAQFPDQSQVQQPAHAPCADPGGRPPQRFDLVIAVDAAGATSEIWVYRGPCHAALRPGSGSGSVPSPALIDKLETLLG